MIQRIQTVYLIIAVLAAILQFLFPVATYTFGNSVDTYMGTISLYLFGLVKQPETLEVSYAFSFYLPMLILAALLIALTVLSILQYKKRLKQLKTVNFAILVNIVLIVLLFFYTDKVSKDVSLTTSYKMGSVFPLISLVFLVLATYAIKRDERLVRSLDRLR
jgi:glucan phosphoethanolaminetransferase (alkaline phosphatase superfamily)